MLGLTLTINPRIWTGSSPLLLGPILKTKTDVAKIINEHIYVKHLFSESSSVLDMMVGGRGMDERMVGWMNRGMEGYGIAVHHMLHGRSK